MEANQSFWVFDLLLKRLKRGGNFQILFLFQSSLVKNPEEALFHLITCNIIMDIPKPLPLLAILLFRLSHWSAVVVIKLRLFNTHRRCWFSGCDFERKLRQDNFGIRIKSALFCRMSYLRSWDDYAPGYGMDWICNLIFGWRFGSWDFAQRWIHLPEFVSVLIRGRNRTEGDGNEMIP